MSNGIVDSRVAVWQFVQVYYMPLIVLSRGNVTKIFFFTLKEYTIFTLYMMYLHIVQVV